jgi:hypothetical protein
MKVLTVALTVDERDEMPKPLDIMAVLLMELAGVSAERIADLRQAQERLRWHWLMERRLLMEDFLLNDGAVPRERLTDCVFFAVPNIENGSTSLRLVYEPRWRVTHQPLPIADLYSCRDFGTKTITQVYE